MIIYWDKRGDVPVQDSGKLLDSRRCAHFLPAEKPN